MIFKAGEKAEAFFKRFLTISNNSAVLQTTLQFSLQYTIKE